MTWFILRIRRNSLDAGVVNLELGVRVHKCTNSTRQKLQKLCAIQNVVVIAVNIVEYYMRIRALSSDLKLIVDGD